MFFLTAHVFPLNTHCSYDSIPPKVKNSSFTVELESKIIFLFQVQVWKNKINIVMIILLGEPTLFFYYL